MAFSSRRSVVHLVSILIAGVLLCSCQGAAEPDDARVAKDSIATAELNRLNNLLASSRPVSKQDVDTLVRLREQYPDSAVVRQILQGALIKREDWAAAERIISEAPEAERKPADKLNLAKIYIKQGRFGEAAEFLKSIGRESSTRVDIAALLGQAQFYDGQLDAAAATFESVRSDLVREKRADELSMLGTIFLRRGDHEKAIGVLEDAIEASPESIPANNAMSRAYAASGDEVKAGVYRSKLKAITEKNEAAEKKKWRLVPLFYQLEDAHAAKDSAKVIALVQQIQPDAEDDGTRAALYQYLGAAYQAQGKDAEARSAFAEAVRLTQQK